MIETTYTLRVEDAEIQSAISGPVSNALLHGAILRLLIRSGAANVTSAHIVGHADSALRCYRCHIEFDAAAWTGRP